MATVSLQELAEIPYLDVPNIAGRTIPSLMFHDAGTWRMWLHAGDKLREIKAWPAEATYFSKDAADPHDLNLRFLDFMAQQASFPELIPATQAIHDDIFNLSACIAKIEHLHATRDAVGKGCHRMVSSEVEYLFLACRSVFDLLQEVATKLWETVHLLEPSVKKRRLKTSFNDMTRFEGRPATVDELAKRFGLPHPWAEFYVAWQPFFEQLRGFRDNVVHRGSAVQTIFDDDKGFFILKSLRPFESMSIWREDERLPNDLVPLLPALGVVIYRTLSACEHFSVVVSSIIRFPPPIAPGMHLFLRGYFNQSFAQALADASRRLADPPETVA